MKIIPATLIRAFDPTGFDGKGGNTNGPRGPKGPRRPGDDDDDAGGKSPSSGLTDAQKVAILNHFVDWSGGWYPTATPDMAKYIEFAMDSNLPEEAVQAWFDELSESADSGIAEYKRLLGKRFNPEAAP